MDRRMDEGIMCEKLRQQRQALGSRLGFGNEHPHPVRSRSPGSAHLQRALVTGREVVGTSPPGMCREVALCQRHSLRSQGVHGRVRDPKGHRSRLAVSVTPAVVGGPWSSAQATQGAAMGAAWRLLSSPGRWLLPPPWHTRGNGGSTQQMVDRQSEPSSSGPEPCVQEDGVSATSEEEGP